MHEKPAPHLLAETLLAGLVPEQRPPGERTDDPAKHHEAYQRIFTHPPAAAFRPRLVPAESGEGAEVDRDEVIGEQFGEREIRHAPGILLLQRPASSYAQNVGERECKAWC